MNQILLEKTKEVLAHFRWIFDHFLFKQNFKCFNDKRAGKWIASIGRTMISRSDIFHDVIITKNGWDRHEASWQSFSK